MQKLEKAKTPELQWERKGELPDWTALPERQKEALLLILAEMMVNYPRQAEEGQNETQP